MTRKLIFGLAELAALFSGTAMTARPQTSASAFAVASVRPSALDESNKTRFDRVTTTPGNVMMKGITIIGAIKWAYKVEAYQVAGPSWIDSTHFDIIAKADGGATDDQMRLMTQTLLADRFRLVVHHDQREMSVMALIIGKSGAKLKASVDQAQGGFEPLNGKPIIKFSRVSMGDFAGKLSETYHKVVVDRTGLDGLFDFTFDATKYFPPPPAPGQSYERVDMEYMILRALQDELGLTLEQRKLTVDRLVVDGIEKVPTQN
jgi:uncharacterized protein (TIGR03435 family)